MLSLLEIKSENMLSNHQRLEHTSTNISKQGNTAIKIEQFEQKFIYPSYYYFRI